MPKYQTRSKKRKTPSSYGPTNTELLENIQEILLHILRNSACMLCRGVGLRVVGEKPDGKPDLSVCVCRRLSLEFLAEFGMGFNPDGTPQDGDPEDEGNASE